MPVTTPLWQLYVSAAASLASITHDANSSCRAETEKLSGSETSAFTLFGSSAADLHPDLAASSRRKSFLNVFLRFYRPVRAIPGRNEIEEVGKWLLFRGVCHRRKPYARLVIAARPNHWNASARILGRRAG